MPIKVITTEFGHSIPPEGKHTITMHAPSWKAMIDFRDGDMSIFQKLVSLYPRFSPWADARQVSRCPFISPSHVKSHCFLSNY